MSENTQTAPAEISKEEKREQAITSINRIISNLEDNKFRIFIYCPPMNAPSGGIGVVFKQVQILRDAGFDAQIIYEPQVDNKASLAESKKLNRQVNIYNKWEPVWLSDELREKVPLRILGNGEMKFNNGDVEKIEMLTINAEDFMIIPEGFPNIMQNYANLPCKKIVFAQSWWYVLTTMQAGQKWQHLGINDVISISEGITQFLETMMPGLNIKTYKQSIDRNIFPVKSPLAKLPKIAYMPGRSEEAAIKTAAVIKAFYAFYPHYQWIRFDALSNLNKEEFSKRLSESAFVLYTDEIAGFGTLPLEAMATGTHVIGWTPQGSKEYQNKENGFWAINGDIFQLADLIGQALERWILGMLDNPEIQKTYEDTLSKYTVEAEKEAIINLYNEYKNDRIKEFTTIKEQQ